MEAAIYIIKPSCSGRLFIINYNNAYIRFLYQKHKMISVKNLHNIPTVDFDKLCNDNSHIGGDKIKI